MRHTNFIFSSQEIEVFYKSYHKDMRIGMIFQMVYFSLLDIANISLSLIHI